MPENISGVPAGRSVFHLTSPFIGLSHSPDGYGRLTKIEHSLFYEKGTFLMSVDIAKDYGLTRGNYCATLLTAYL